jgi:glycosyltransferase involved in cell wall biosynthesis
MRIALVNPLFPAAAKYRERWITVPPQGYGGIQWVVATVMYALLDRDHEVTLYGAPGSEKISRRLTIIDTANLAAIGAAVSCGEYDIVHDFSNGLMTFPGLDRIEHLLSTYSLTGAPSLRRNVVFLSFAQREAAGYAAAPVIRIPVDPRFFRFSCEKDDYLLFLGRISPWKGALEAARFARASGSRLKLAGPNWEPKYFHTIMDKYGDAVDYVGEVSGEKRLQLLSEARALLVMSQPVPGPWGSVWSEPGSTVVSEAAACGTPIVSTDNGCLAEITPHVGLVVPSGERGAENAARVLRELPNPEAVRAAAMREWSSTKIIQEYEHLYGRVMQRERWLK